MEEAINSTCVSSRVWVRACVRACVIIAATSLWFIEKIVCGISTGVPLLQIQQGKVKIEDHGGKHTNQIKEWSIKTKGERLKRKRHSIKNILKI